MSLFDFLFPEQAQASHLRRMADRQDRQARMDRIRSRSQDNLEQRIEELERDVGIITLVVAAILDKANESGAVSADEIKEAIKDLDVLDGFRDGRLDASVLRRWTE